jgi:uncharacterized protein (UPF0332 family)
MKDSTIDMLSKANRAIEAAEQLNKSGYQEFAIGRAYYAMFYIAEALLNEKDYRFSKHGNVHGAFGEHFVKTGEFDKKYHRWLLDAFDNRISGDYGIDVYFSSEEVAETIIQAREFLSVASKYPGMS